MVRNAETGQMPEEGERPLDAVLEKITNFASRRPSFSEIGLKRYFCDVIGSGGQELGCYLNMISEMEALIGEPSSCSSIGGFNIGRPHHCSKEVYILWRCYTAAFRLKPPAVITGTRLLIRKKMTNSTGSEGAVLVTSRGAMSSVKSMHTAARTPWGVNFERIICQIL
jgi:hypothetical protein